MWESDVSARQSGLVGVDRVVPATMTTTKELTGSMYVSIVCAVGWVFQPTVLDKAHAVPRDRFGRTGLLGRRINGGRASCVFMRSGPPSFFWVKGSMDWRAAT
jgi:hypothetical protein